MMRNLIRRTRVHLAPLHLVGVVLLALSLVSGVEPTDEDHATDDTTTDEDDPTDDATGDDSIESIEWGPRFR